MIKMAQAQEKMALIKQPDPQVKLAAECLVKSVELMENLGHEKFAEEVIKILGKIVESK